MRPDEPNKPNKKLERNNVFAANKKDIKNGNNFARLVGLLTILLVCGSVAYFAHAYFSAMSSVQLIKLAAVKEPHERLERY